MFWVATGLLSPVNKQQQPETKGPYSHLRRYSFYLTLLIFMMILSGGFVAGIHAGKAYNTFPLMDGHLIPPGLFVLEPWYRNFFENITTVQFDHRLIAWLLAFLVPLFWLKSMKHTLSPSAKMACHLLFLALILQISLGIATLLSVVPLGLAATHQAGAMVLFTASLWVNRKLSSS